MIYKTENSKTVYDFWKYCIDNGYVMEITDAYNILCDANDQKQLINKCDTRDEYFDQLIDKFVHEDSCI